MQFNSGKNGNGDGKHIPAHINDFFNNTLLLPSLPTTGPRMPPTNISETKNEFLFELSVPGLKKEDFNVEIEDGHLVISSEKKEEHKEEKGNYWTQEFSYSGFTRRFVLPENVAEDKVKAKYDNGMLLITIPKKDTTLNTPKKSIKVG